MVLAKHFPTCFLAGSVAYHDGVNEQHISRCVGEVIQHQREKGVMGDEIFFLVGGAGEISAYSYIAAQRKLLRAISLRKLR